MSFASGQTTDAGGSPGESSHYQEPLYALFIQGEMGAPQNSSKIMSNRTDIDKNRREDNVRKRGATSVWADGWEPNLSSRHPDGCWTAQDTHAFWKEAYREMYERRIFTAKQPKFKHALVWSFETFCAQNELPPDHPDSRKVFQLLRTFINDDMDKISSHLAHTHTNSFRDWDSEVNDFISKQSDRLNCT